MKQYPTPRISPGLPQPPLPGPRVNFYCYAAVSVLCCKMSKMSQLFRNAFPKLPEAKSKMVELVTQTSFSVLSILKVYCA